MDPVALEKAFEIYPDVRVVVVAHLYGTPGKIDAKDFGKDWNLLMDNSNPTCRSLDKVYKNADKKDCYYYMLDGFILSKNLQVDSIKTENLNFKNSDHNPVILKATLS